MAPAVFAVSLSSQRSGLANTARVVKRADAPVPHLHVDLAEFATVDLSARLVRFRNRAPPDGRPVRGQKRNTWLNMSLRRRSRADTELSASIGALRCPFLKRAASLQSLKRSVGGIRVNVDTSNINTFATANDRRGNYPTARFLA